MANGLARSRRGRRSLAQIFGRHRPKRARTCADNSALRSPVTAVSYRCSQLLPRENKCEMSSFHRRPRTRDANKTLVSPPWSFLVNLELQHVSRRGHRLRVSGVLRTSFAIVELSSSETELIMEGGIHTLIDFVEFPEIRADHRLIACARRFQGACHDFRSRQDVGF